MNVKKMAKAKNVSRMKLFAVAAILAIAGGVFAFSGIAPEAMNALTPYSCTDTDGGKNPDKLGAIKLYNSLSRRSSVITDSCAGRNLVLEGYCDPRRNNSYGQVQMKCTNGICKNGACVPTPPTPPVSYTFNLAKHPSSTPATVLPGTSNVILAKYSVDLVGAQLELSQIALGITTNTRGILSGSILVKVNGASVLALSPNQINNSATNLNQFNLSSYPTIASGRHTITVEGNIASSAQNGSVVNVYFDILKVRRTTAGQVHFDPNFTPVLSDTITVQSGALIVTTGSGGGSPAVVAGEANVTLANLRLNASALSSGEDVKVSSLIITDTLSNGGNYSDIGNLALYDTTNNTLLATIASTAVNAGTNRFVFANPIIVPKIGSGVTLILKGDILGGSGNHKFAIIAPADVVAVGRDTGTAITTQIDPNGGGTITSIEAAGGMAISLVPGSTGAPANDRTVYVGNSDVPVFAFKIKANSEPVKINYLKLTASGFISSTLDITNIRLYRNDETNAFASAEQLTRDTGTIGGYSFAWTATDNILPSAIQPNTEVTVYVKASIGGAGQAVLGDNFRFGIMSNSHLTGKGVSSASALQATGAPIIASGATHIAPFRVLVTGDVPVSGSSVTQATLAGTQLARIKVQNDGTAQISLTHIKFTDFGFHTGNNTTYKLSYSDQNSSNYTGNTFGTGQNPPTFYPQIEDITIDGGSSRYLTLAISNLGSAQTGDNWLFGIERFGDVSYRLAETDLGYDANANGTLGGWTQNIPAEGRPILGMIVKQ